MGISTIGIDISGFHGRQFRDPADTNIAN